MAALVILFEQLLHIDVSKPRKPGVETQKQKQKDSCSLHKQEPFNAIRRSLSFLHLVAVSD